MNPALYFMDLLPSYPPISNQETHFIIDKDDYDTAYLEGPVSDDDGYAKVKLALSRSYFFDMRWTEMETFNVDPVSRSNCLYIVQLSHLSDPLSSRANLV